MEFREKMEKKENREKRGRMEEPLIHILLMRTLQMVQMTLIYLTVTALILVCMWTLQKQIV